jgi:hypothetical protein
VNTLPPAIRPHTLEKAVQILKNVPLTLGSEVRWTRGSYARDHKGLRVSFDSPDANCYCLVGAVRATGAQLYPDFDLKAYETIQDVLSTVIRKRGQGGVILCNGPVITHFNDDPGTTYSMVLEVVQEAQQLLKQYQDLQNNSINP